MAIFLVAGLRDFSFIVSLLSSRDVVIYQRREYKRNGDVHNPADIHPERKESGNPDSSSNSYQFFFTEKPDGFRETLVLME